MVSKIDLQNAALALFSKYGVKSVKLDDISQQLGISKKSIYGHFTNKEDIIVSIFESLAREGFKNLKSLEKDPTLHAINKMVSVLTFWKNETLKLNPIFIMQATKYYSKVNNILKRVASNSDDLILVLLKDLQNQDLVREWVKIDYVLQTQKALFELHLSKFPFNYFTYEDHFNHLMMTNFLGILNKSGLDELDKNNALASLHDSTENFRSD